MIVRFGSLIVLLYALGFILFTVTLGKPAGKDSARTDAAADATCRVGSIAPWWPGASRGRRSSSTS